MSALETLLEKCSTDAQRVTMLREALDLAEREAVAVARLSVVVHLAAGATWKARCGFSEAKHTVAEDAVDVYPDYRICPRCVVVVLNERATARAAVEAEKADHLATAKRWWKIAAGLDKAIAKARRIMRGPGAKHPTLRSPKQFADVYVALDKRRIGR